MIKKFLLTLLILLCCTSCKQSDNIKSIIEIQPLEYRCAVQIEGKIYACVKNSLISFDENLLNRKILYSNQDYIIEGLFVADRNTVYLQMDDDGDPPIYKWIKYNILTNSTEAFLDDIEDPVFYNNTLFYYFNNEVIKEQNGSKTSIVKNVSQYRLNSKHIVYTLKDENGVVYSCDLNGKNIRKELEGVKAFNLTEDFILFNKTWFPDYDASIYNMNEQKTYDLGIKFNIDEALIHDERIYTKGKIVRIKDITIYDSKMKWADYSYKAAIGDWIYLREAEYGDGITINYMHLFRVKEDDKYEAIMSEGSPEEIN